METITLDDILTHDASCNEADPYRPSCRHDELDGALRNLLIIDEDDRLPTQDGELLDLMFEPSFNALPALRLMITLLDEIRGDTYKRDHFSMLRYEHSLCPLHGYDYAICFDDEDPSCEAIRHCFPNHDT